MNRSACSAACLSLFALLLHCGSAPDRALIRGSTVTIAHSMPTQSAIDPSDYQPEARLLFLPLFRINESGELEGVLAESWDLDAETNEVTYHLRTDVRWHDSVPVTAHDVKFSMDLMTHPDVLIEGPDFFGPVEVLDDSTLRVRNGLGGLAEGFWPKHLLENLDPAEIRNWDFWNHPVGNGPYRFSGFQPNVFLELEANADYFGGKPAIDKVVFKYVGEAAVRELLAGNIDIAGVRPIDALALADDPRFNIYYRYANWWSCDLLFWRHENPLFEDAEVRRALTMAINRQELLRIIHLPESTPMIDAPFSLRQLARNQFPEPIPYDPQRAKALLERAGWIDRDADGVLDKEGRPFRFTALVSNRGGGMLVDMATYIREQLRKLGLEMEILTADTGVVNQRVNRGEFEAAIRPWGLVYGTKLLKTIGYEDPELNDLAVKLADQPYHALLEEERAMYERVHAIFQRDVPVTYLGPRIFPTVAHRRIKGLSSYWGADLASVRIEGDP